MGRTEIQQVTLRNGEIATLRSADPDDAAALLEFVPRVARETEFLLVDGTDFGMTLEKEREWVQAKLDCPGSVVVTALVGGRIVGNSTLDRPKRTRIAHTAMLGISVLQAYCGVGLGRAMMERLIAFAEQSPVLEKVYLDVFAHNTRARRLYESVGFVEEGRFTRAVKYADGRYTDEIRMGRPVKPVAAVTSYCTEEALLKGAGS